MEERLHKILARAGLASRRAAETMIAAGRVAVDGQIVTSPGSKADLARQSVTLDGKTVKHKPDFHYWIVYKPLGILSTRFDPQQRRTVMSLLPAHLREILYPVGRLDLDSEGLMLFTNDGELAYRLMHPRFKVPKVYKAWVAGQPEEESLERLRQGIFIEGKKTAPAQAELLRAGIYRSQLSLTLVEGRKREIRLMCQAIGHPVIQLVRLKLGSISLGSLEKGKARGLIMAEVHTLKKLVGLGDEQKPPKNAPQDKPRTQAGRSPDGRRLHPPQAGTGRRTNERAEARQRDEAARSKPTPASKPKNAPQDKPRTQAGRSPDGRRANEGGRVKGRQRNELTKSKPKARPQARKP